MGKVISGFYGAIVALLVTIVHDNLFLNILHWPTSASLLGALGIGTILLIIYEVMSGSNKFLRLTSPISRIEGAWEIEILNAEERPESVCKINLSHGKYIYSGYGITTNKKLGAEWISRDVHYDEKIDELSFTSDATIVDSGKRIRNYGYIKFYKDANGKYTYGSGYFVDMADELDHHYMKLTRITDKQFDERVANLFNSVT